MPARQRRPPGRAQASARGVAALKRRHRYAFRPTSCGANAWTATQTMTPVRNAGYPNGEAPPSTLGSQVESSGTRMMMSVTMKSDTKKIIAPRSTVWMGIWAMPLTA